MVRHHASAGSTHGKQRQRRNNIRLTVALNDRAAGFIAATRADKATTKRHSTSPLLYRYANNAKSMRDDRLTIVLSERGTTSINDENTKDAVQAR
jgi:hypothetical protein